MEQKRKNLCLLRPTREAVSVELLIALELGRVMMIQLIGGLQWAGQKMCRLIDGLDGSPSHRYQHWTAGVDWMGTSNYRTHARVAGTLLFHAESLHIKGPPQQHTDFLMQHLPVEMNTCSCHWITLQ